mmetsp:Transcript_4565/g.6914  ORF Transcript_4565/g.6914 Transcript_4565/m.6914 type:complete len:92 (-) Transcript_4565:1791-2066(-)
MEEDLIEDDGQTIFVPCSNTKKTYDLFLPKSGSELGQTINDVTTAVSTVNEFNPSPTHIPVAISMTGIGMLATSSFIYETNAFYSLRVQGL